MVNSIASFNGLDGIDILNGNAIGNITISNRVAGINVFCPGTIIGNTSTSNGNNLFTSGASCVAANNSAP